MKILSILILLMFSLPGFAQEEDPDLEKLEAARKRQSDLVKSLSGPAKKEETPQNVPEELKALGYNSLNAKSLMDERVVHLYQKILRQSPMHLVPLKQVEGLILEKTKDSMMGPFLEANPGLLTCIASIIKDKEAMASAMGIFLRKGSLKLYFMIYICYMIMSWLIKKLVLDDYWPRWKYHSVSLFITLFILLASFTTFYSIFRKELSPTVKIISQHLAAS